MKILLLAPVPPPYHGGIVNWSRLLNNFFFESEDCKLTFVDSMQRNIEVTNKSIIARFFWGTLQAFKDITKVTYQFVFIRPDVFHLCTSGGPATLKDTLLMFIANLFKVPVIVHYRMGRLPEILKSQNFEKYLLKYIFSFSSGILLLGKNSENAVKNIAPGKLVLNFPNMVDLDEIDKFRDSCSEINRHIKTAKIAYVGWVVPTKGVIELVEACSELVETNIELHLVGPCSIAFCEKLKSIAHAKTKSTEWLRFHGSVSHDVALQSIAECDLFVLPSYTEGAPNVILEAMGMGKPILSTSVGSIPEMLSVDSSEPCGTCVPPASSVSISNALHNYFADPLKWHKFGCNARRRSEKIYSVSVVCGKLFDLWLNVSKKTVPPDLKKKS